jgi:hypothetical protein
LSSEQEVVGSNPTGGTTLKFKERYVNYVINGQTYSFTSADLLILILLIVWSYCWKVPAIWRSVKNENKKWFVVFIIINTFGILEIAYLMYFSKKPDSEK